MDDRSARKRLVTRTVNEGLPPQARSLNDIFFNVGETHPADQVAREQQAREVRARECSAVSASWNRFNEARGSFADGFSPL